MTTQLEIDWTGRAARAAGRDICANRHQGNAESRAAFARVDVTEGQRTVLAHIEAAGRHGLTCKECAGIMLVEMHFLSGRYSELKRDGLIIATGERRLGSMAYKIAE